MLATCSLLVYINYILLFQSGRIIIIPRISQLRQTRVDPSCSIQPGPSTSQPIQKVRQSRATRPRCTDVPWVTTSADQSTFWESDSFNFKCRGRQLTRSQQVQPWRRVGLGYVVVQPSPELLPNAGGISTEVCQDIVTQHPPPPVCSVFAFPYHRL